MKNPTITTFTVAIPSDNVEKFLLWLPLLGGVVITKPATKKAPKEEKETWQPVTVKRANGECYEIDGITAEKMYRKFRPKEQNLSDGRCKSLFPDFSTRANWYASDKANADVTWGEDGKEWSSPTATREYVKQFSMSCGHVMEV